MEVCSSWLAGSSAGAGNAMVVASLSAGVRGLANLSCDRHPRYGCLYEKDDLVLDGDVSDCCTCPLAMVVAAPVLFLWNWYWYWYWWWWLKEALVEAQGLLAALLSRDVDHRVNGCPKGAGLSRTGECPEPRLLRDGVLLPVAFCDDECHLLDAFVWFLCPSRNPWLGTWFCLYQSGTCSFWRER